MMGCLVKFYRSKEYGTDLPVTALIFLSQIFFLKLYKSFNHILFGKLLIFSIFAFFLKVYSFLIFIFFIYFIKYFNEIYFFLKKNYKLTFFLLLFSIISFSKTFILTGCFVYPEPKTCISKDNIEWGYGKNLTKSRKDFLTAGSKGWRQYLKLNDYKVLITAKDYLQEHKIDYLYYVFQDNDRERILLPIIISFLIFCIFFFFYRKPLNKDILPSSILSLSGIIFLIWLYLFPISKYGGYAYILFFVYLFLYKIFNTFYLNKKFVSSLLIFCCIFFTFKSFGRIYDEISPAEKHIIDINFNNSNFPIPIFRKISSYTSSINGFNVNISKDGFECSNISPICVPKYSKDLISLKNKFGYLIVTGDEEMLKIYQQLWTDSTHYLVD